MIELINTKEISDSVNQAMWVNKARQRDLIKNNDISYEMIRKVRDGSENSSVDNYNKVIECFAVIKSVESIKLIKVSEDINNYMRANKVSQLLIASKTKLSLPTIKNITEANERVSILNYNKVIKCLNEIEDEKQD